MCVCFGAWGCKVLCHATHRQTCIHWAIHNVNKWYNKWCLPTSCLFITHMWFSDCQTTTQCTWSVKLNTSRTFLKDVLSCSESVNKNAKHECNWVAFSLSVPVSACICVDWGYFICIASSYGNNLDFFFQFSFWNELSCGCFINGASCTELGVCDTICLRGPGLFPFWCL